jgi:hypothetical protein
LAVEDDVVLNGKSENAGAEVGPQAADARGYG